MRFLVWLLGLPVIGAAVIFALQNRARVEISFWPFEARATLPLSVLIAALLLIGFTLGTLAAGMGTLSAAWTNRRLSREKKDLESKLAQAKNTASAPGPLSTGATILSQGRYRPAADALPSPTCLKGDPRP